MEKGKFLNNLGKRIRQAREKKKLSLYDLSIETGLSKQQLIGIEHGKVNTSVYSLKLITEALDISADELMKE